jgi:hypothetical protein
MCVCRGTSDATADLGWLREHPARPANFIHHVQLEAVWCSPYSRCAIGPAFLVPAPCITYCLCCTPQTAGIYVFPLSMWTCRMSCCLLMHSCPQPLCEPEQDRKGYPRWARGKRWWQHGWRGLARTQPPTCSSLDIPLPRPHWHPPLLLPGKLPAPCPLSNPFFSLRSSSLSLPQRRKGNPKLCHCRKVVISSCWYLCISGMLMMLHVVTPVCHW